MSDWNEENEEDILHINRFHKDFLLKWNFKTFVTKKVEKSLFHSNLRIK